MADPPTTTPTTLLSRVRSVARHPATRTVAAIIGIIVGGLLVLVAAAVGHCSFAGGRCPADPVPFWQDDVFGTAAAGLALLVAAPVLAWRPSRRGLVTAALGVVATLPVAWMLAEAARTGGW